MISFGSYLFPKTAGVYIFKDEYNTILYIGKAKNIHKRILSYQTDKQIDWKIDALLKKSHHIDWILTENEQQALLLEAQLISEQKPLFNKLLTSSTPFIYIVLKKDKNKIPKIEITRYHSLKSDFIIGPFLVKKEAVKLYEYIMSFFNLYHCNKKIPHGCLHFHIKKCSGSCKPDFDEAAYLKRYNLAKIALKDQKGFFALLEKEIKKAMTEFDLENLETLLHYKEQYLDIIAILDKQKDEKQAETIDVALIDIAFEEALFTKALTQLQSLLHLETLPHVIDCIDISHFQGHAVTGACVRFIEGKYRRDQSHVYKLPLEENNDYQNLKLLLQMHYKTLNNKPDILLIDGGKGQLSTVQHLHLNIPLLALAKKEERLFTETDLEGMIISGKEPFGRLLLSLRNATHNAAIRLHKRLFKSTYY
jgi:excinuclease ABC subunit C